MERGGIKVKHLEKSFLRPVSFFIQLLDKKCIQRQELYQSTSVSNSKFLSLLEMRRNQLTIQFVARKYLQLLNQLY